MKYLFFLVVIFISLIYGCTKDEKEDSDDFSKNSGTFIDERDGNEYDWVRIGEQIWMTENLAYLPAVNPATANSKTDRYYYVYGYNGNDADAAKATDNYKTYGILYNWQAAMQASPSSWHLSNDADWEQLAQYINKQMGPYSKAINRWLEVGGHLKTINGWYNDGNGTDDFAFSALPGGFRYHPDTFESIGHYGYWWSSSDYGNDNAWFRALGCYLSEFYWNFEDKTMGFSVRFVKD